MPYRLILLRNNELASITASSEPAISISFKRVATRGYPNHVKLISFKPRRSSSVENSLVTVSMSSPTRATTHTNRNDNDRRQLSTARRRAQRQLMSQEQRQAHLARRRSNYQRQMNISASSTYSEASNLDISDVTINLNEGEQNISHQRAQRRISERHRRQSMTSDARTTYLAHRRAAYHRRTETSITSFNSDSSNPITNNLATTVTTHARIETSSNQVINATMVGQMCHMQAIPYQMLTSNFEQGTTSTCQQPKNYDHQGQRLNLLLHADVDETEDFNAAQTDAIAIYQRNELRLNARLHMPTRMRIISLGWKIRIGINSYDFGRLILRIFRKLRRHTTKRLGWIEGWDLTEKGIAARRQIEEKTLFREKIRPANDIDIKTFYMLRTDQDKARFG